MSEPLAGTYDGAGCGCDGSRPCGDDTACAPAVFVACGECNRVGSEECIYPHERVQDGCYFPKEATDE